MRSTAIRWAGVICERLVLPIAMFTADGLSLPDSSTTQCAAVTTQWLVIRVPPQNCAS